MSKKCTSMILTCLGAVGFVTTTVLAVRATPKALELLQQAEEEKGEDLTLIEKVKIAGPAYIPAASIGSATLICIFGANALDKKRQASLVSAYAMAENAYKKYRSKVIEQSATVDKDAIEAVAFEDLEDISDYDPNERQLIYDMHMGQYYEGRVDHVQLDDGLECWVIDIDREFHKRPYEGGEML